MTITTRDMSHGWDIDAPEPIRRTYCLHLHWADEDPMPTRCSLAYGHEGNHRAAAAGGTLRALGPLVTWPNAEGAAA